MGGATSSTPYLATASFDGKIKIWRNDRCITELKGHEFTIHDLLYVPSRNVLISAGRFGYIKI